MFNIFKKKKRDASAIKDDKIVALSCLLVEAALVDEDFGEDEKKVIFNILKKQFKNKSDSSINKIITEAIDSFNNSSDLVTHTRKIKENWELNDRINIIEMLWKVCLVDGQLEPYEDMLIRRVSGLIYVDDKNRSLAKKNALDSLNN
ncbi:TerB family tellurite resistance protein [Alphaproteobacteria bacterium]|nr:TerB family tellurite resistance protein [Alphaproteobacteria bacterium]